MSFYKFSTEDVFVNNLKTYPSFDFFINDAKMYLNNKNQISGAFTSSVGCIPTGFVSLYELNVDRDSGSTGFIYPYIIKAANRTSFSTVSTSNFNDSYDFGDIITGSYPMSSSLHRDYYQLGQTRPRLKALYNTLNYYKKNSLHFSYSSSLGDKDTQQLTLISIPGILYGSSIKKGSIKLDYYITGTLIGTLEDRNKNGELIQTGPSGSTGSGSVAGVALYNEGFLILTGTWALETGIARNYLNDTINLATSSWVHFGNGIPGNVVTPASTTSFISASYNMYYEGTHIIPNLTMLATAPKNELNYSNNLSFTNTIQQAKFTGSTFYVEDQNVEITNTVSSSYPDPTGSFKNQTFISQIGIYDEQKNLIAIAKLSKPVKKTEERDLTFKLKIDL